MIKDKVVIITGSAKGIGRLATHKLARLLAIESVPWESAPGDTRPIRAGINWDAVEALPTLDSLADSEAITLTIEERTGTRRAS